VLDYQLNIVVDFLLTTTYYLSMTFDATITRERCINGSDVEEEIEIEVEYETEGASRGCRDSMGVPEEPDEDASIEITGATDKATGEEIELTKNEEEKLIIKIENSLS
jgi:hypothetical protein